MASMRNYRSSERREHESNYCNIVSGIYYGDSRRNRHVFAVAVDYHDFKECRMISAFCTGVLVGFLCGIFFISMRKSAKRRDSIES